METVHCKKHDITLQLPLTSEERLSGKFHDDVVFLVEHHERHPNCVFKEVQN